MSAYSEKLKDPRWQKVRLSVLERAGWKCQCCNDTKETLHIHHLIYSKGEPWDAPIETLECLCDTCHKWREMFNDFFCGRSLVPTAFCQIFVGRYEPVFTGEMPWTGTIEHPLGLADAALAWFKQRDQQHVEPEIKTPDTSGAVTWRGGKPVMVEPKP